ncbi:AraC-type DNA-binding protein [Lachnospiraceae bacterium C7]|nr:AraC-type DNA-binding protein [Lachnospiraceae bacterium C7]
MNKTILNKLSPITKEEDRILKGATNVEKNLYTNLGKFIIDSNKILTSGSLIQIRTHTRFIDFPKHTHNYVEMVYMCSGSTHHTVNGNKIDLGTGELLIMNQNAVQEISAAGVNDIAINFIILPEFFDQTLRFLGHEHNALNDFLTSCLGTSQSKVDYLHFKVSNILPIQNLVENLIYSLLYEKESNDMANEITMGLLFLQLLSHTEVMDTDKGSYEQKIVFDVLKYIDLHYKDGSLTDIANSLHLELTYLSRVIHKYTGFNYKEILQQKRLSKALELLTTSTLSIADISYSVGYENVSYFYRLFKKYYGQTPRDYRKSN